LRQRISFQHQLGTLSREEAKHYLSHRLAIAGYAGDEPFSAFAVKAIHRASHGVPRLMNILANKAMMLAYGEGGRRIKRRHVLAAISDTPASFALSRAWLWLALACVACSSIGWVVLR
jgi:MSHA biogenesis protein MshM